MLKARERCETCSTLAPCDCIIVEHAGSMWCWRLAAGRQCDRPQSSNARLIGATVDLYDIWLGWTFLGQNVKKRVVGKHGARHLSQHQSQIAVQCQHGLSCS